MCQIRTPKAVVWTGRIARTSRNFFNFLAHDDCFPSLSQRTALPIRTSGDAHQRGSRCASTRAGMRRGTGGDAHRDGKPSRWFAKSIALVLQKYRVGFYKPSRWFPVLLTSQARNHCHLCPFRSDCLPVSLMLFRRALAHLVCRACRLADPDKRTIAAPPLRQMRLRSCYTGVARQRARTPLPTNPFAERGLAV